MNPSRMIGGYYNSILSDNTSDIESNLYGIGSTNLVNPMPTLNPKLNKELVDSGLQRINISLEGLTSERYLKVAQAKIVWEDFVANIKDLYEYSRTKGDLVIYVKVVNNASELKGKTVFSMTEEEKNYFYKTFGDIADEIYIEKIVPQWAETQEDKQNAVDYTGMYDQKTVKYKKV